MTCINRLVRKSSMYNPQLIVLEVWGEEAGHKYLPNI